MADEIRYKVTLTLRHPTSDTPGEINSWVMHEAGEEIEVSESDAKRLVSAGLATCSTSDAKKLGVE